MEVRGWHIPTWVTLVVPLVYLWHKYVTRTFDTFKAQGIKGPSPSPIFGNMRQLLKKGFIQFDANNRREYGDLVATFQGSVPQLVIYDKDMLIQILVKEFPSFRNRYSPIQNGYGVKMMMTLLVDDHWKHVRSTVSPTFTSGRLRSMTQQINHCAQTLVAHIDTKAMNDQMFDFKECCGAYALDVIASTAFDLDIDSQNDPNNDFVKNAKELFTFGKFSIRLFLLVAFPFLTRYIAFFPKQTMTFFLDAVTKAMEVRKTDSGSQRNDFLHLMAKAHLDDMEHEHGDLDEDEDNDFSRSATGEIWSKKGLTREEILGQGFMFFMAGFDTVSTSLSFLGYNLACNPDKQQILIDEIDQIMAGHETADYDLVRQMKYLDMVVEESLRMFPPAPRLNRVASQDITINGVFIAKGTIINIPVYNLHHDPDVWPDPDKFIPERFAPDMKGSRHPCSYLPFGLGPRDCFAKRLALFEIKTSLVQLLLQFRLVTCEETQIPIKLQKLILKAETGIILKAVER